MTKTAIANVDLVNKQGYAVKLVADDTYGRKYDLAGAGDKVDGVVDANGITKAGDVFGINNNGGTVAYGYVSGAVLIGARLIAGAGGVLITMPTATAITTQANVAEPFARALQASAGSELIKIEIL